MYISKRLARLSVTGAMLGLALSSHPATAETKDAAPEARLTPVHTALLYHQVSGEPAPVVNMMAKPLNLRFDNEFERRRFAKEAFPAFKELADDVLRQPAYYARFSVRLDDYDFNEERFPLNGVYSGSMYFYYDAGKAGSEGMDYAVRIVNTDEIKFLDAPMEEAEAMLNRVGGKISAEMWMVPVSPVSAGWIKLKNDYYRTVQMKATMLKLFDANGNLIAEIESESAGLKNKAKAVKSNPIREPEFSNPWMADDAPTAILDHYKWYIDKSYKVPNAEYGADSFQDAMELGGAVSGGCIAKFGYSECNRLSSARQQMVNRCTNTVSANRKSECYQIRYLPYTTEEADSYSNRTSD